MAQWTRQGRASVLGLPPVPFTRLYSYASAWDIAAVVLACVCGAASGAILPLFSILFGGALNAVNDPTTDIVASVSALSLKFVYIAVAAGALSFTEQALISYTTEAQLARLRAAYCKALLRLDTAWFDTHRAGECVTRLAEASASVGAGMEKLATTVRYSATLVTGVAIGFSTSWKLTLVISACAPLFAIALGVLIFTAISSESAERTAYARAGDVANEVLSLVRAVAAYGGEAHESRRYSKFLAAAEAAGIRKGVGIGVAVGFMLITFYSMYGISTFAGAKLVVASREADAACRFPPYPAGCFTGGQIISASTLVASTGHFNMPLASFKVASAFNKRRYPPPPLQPRLLPCCSARCLLDKWALSSGQYLPRAPPPRTCTASSTRGRAWTSAARAATRPPPRRPPRAPACLWSSGA